MSKKITAFLAALIFMITSLPLAGFADDAEETDTQPTFKVIGSTIKNNDKFFELTMQVTTGSVGFFSAGMTLRYDKSVITPVSWDSDGTSVPVSGCNNWQNIASVPAVCPADISGKTALAYEDADTNDGYMYISAETALPVDVDTLPNDGKILTVRFKYAGSDSDAIAASKEQVINNFENIVSLAPDAVAAVSPAGQMAFYDTGNGTKYYYTADDENTAGIKYDALLAAPEFTLEEDAESANTGGGSNTSNFAALVFFDWDESTLLGSMVVDGSLAATEITAQTESYAKTLMPADMGWSKDNASEITTYDSTYALTSHNGYTFGKWIDYDSEDFTVYGEAVNLTSASKIENITEPKDPDYSKISEGMTFKAAYVANTTMDTATILKTPALRRYTITTDTDPNGGYYARFGTSNNYSVKVTVSRENSSQPPQPVQRTRETALRVTYKIGTTEVVSLSKIENKDKQTVEVAAPSNATSVSFSVIDIGGISNWATGSAVRSAALSVASSDYILLGNINYLNELAASESDSVPAATFFTLAGLDITVVDGATGTDYDIRQKAVSNILEGQRQKQEDQGENSKYLSQTEMQNAITYGNYLGNIS